MKIVLSAAVGCLGAYGVIADRQYVASTDAVVSSYVLEVRTPIEGTLHGMPFTAGDRVAAGALLGRVDDALTDHQHLDNLRLTEQAAQATADSLAHEQQVLQHLQQTLLTRAATHRGAVGIRLDHEVESSRLLLRSTRTSLQEAELEAERGEKLVGWGVISRAAFDKLRSTREVLATQVQAQQQSLAALQAEQAALGEGVLSEPGTNNDVPYSLQRSDEVSLRLADNSRSLDDARAQARQAHLAVVVEEERASLLHHSEVLAPSAGYIWKLDAVNGEHVAGDSPILSMVDCDRPFVLAEVPQDRTSTILPNGKVGIKLTGEEGERSGTVVSVSGEVKLGQDVKLAATPLRRVKEDLATVLIHLDAAPDKDSAKGPCLVGRTARVRIPTQSTNLLTLWLSQRL